MDLLRLVVLAAVGEAIWETLKMTFQSGKLSIDRVGALIFGLLLSCGTGIDIMSMVGIPMVVPYIGMILTGILLSRGANFIHDFLGTINSIKTNANTSAAAIQLLTSQTIKDVSNMSQVYSQPTESKPINNANLETTATIDDDIPESKSTITLAGANDK